VTKDSGITLIKGSNRWSGIACSVAQAFAIHVSFKGVVLMVKEHKEVIE